MDFNQKARYQKSHDFKEWPLTEGSVVRLGALEHPTNFRPNRPRLAYGCLGQELRGRRKDVSYKSRY